MNIEEIKKSFGARVRECRKSHGLSQEELAHRINKSVDTISNIERGYAATKISTAAELANILDVELTDFFRDEKAVSDCGELSDELYNVVLRISKTSSEEKLLKLLLNIEDVMLSE